MVAVADWSVYPMLLTLLAPDHPMFGSYARRVMLRVRVSTVRSSSSRRVAVNVNEAVPMLFVAYVVVAALLLEEIDTAEDDLFQTTEPPGMLCVAVVTTVADALSSTTVLEVGPLRLKSNALCCAEIVVSEVTFAMTTPSNFNTGLMRYVLFEVPTLSRERRIVNVAEFAVIVSLNVATE